MNNDDIVKSLILENVLRVDNAKLKTIRLANLKLFSNYTTLSSNYPNMPDVIILDIIKTHNGIVPLCVFCNDILDMNSLSNYRPIVYAHKECSKNDRMQKIDYETAIKKRNKTCIDRYGKTTKPQSNKTKLKRKETCVVKYGTDVVSKNVDIQNKARNSKLNEYGDCNFNNRQLATKTCIDRYGVENVSQHEKFKLKRKATFVDRYDGIGFASEIINDKIEKTVYSRYGVNNIMHSDEYSSKAIDIRNFNHYGKDKYELLNKHLDKLYLYYVNTPNETLTTLSEKYGISRHTISEYFTKKEFDILHRKSNGRSYGEIELERIVMKIDPTCNITRNDRNVIYPKEIDLYLPDYKVGIEFHGSYWHTKDRVNDLHYDKAAMAYHAGICLLQIFDFVLDASYEFVEYVIWAAMFPEMVDHSHSCVVDGLYPININNLKNKMFLKEHEKSKIINNNILDAGIFTFQHERISIKK